jgi:hypothetical protein
MPLDYKKWEGMFLPQHILVLNITFGYVSLILFMYTNIYVHFFLMR